MQMKAAHGKAHESIYRQRFVCFIIHVDKGKRLAVFQLISLEERIEMSGCKMS